MRQIILILVCTLIPITIGNSQETLIEKYLPISPAPGAEEIFGVTDTTVAFSENCGKGDSVLNRNMGNVCVGNYIATAVANLRAFVTLDVFYRTIFKLTVVDENDVETSSRDVRFTRFEFSGSSFGKYGIGFVMKSSLVDQLCKVVGTNCLSDGYDGLVQSSYLAISKDFFTDFKIDFNDGESYNKWCDGDCSDTLCLHFRPLLYYGACKCFTISVGIREKRGGGSTNYFKTIEINAFYRGDFRPFGASDALFHVKNGELTPLITAAACTSKCLDLSSGMTYCGGDADCPAGSTLVDYDGSIGANYPEHLISEHAYIRERDCNSNDAYNVCASLMTAIPAAFASNNIIFDHDLGGKPRCDCAPRYMWDDILKTCVECNIVGSLSTKCAVPCDGRCGDNEECLMDNNEVQNCYCKPHFTRMSKQGKCEVKTSCENGTMISTPDGDVCQCKDGYYMSNNSGLCVSKSQPICTSGTNPPPCSTVENNVSRCTCDDGSIIPSGMCESSNCNCQSHEECALDESGSVMCACSDDYTRLSDEQCCFAILDCDAGETLRYNDDDNEIFCSCKEGRIVKQEGDTIMCLDGNNNKFDCFFGIIFMILFNLLYSIS